MIYSWLISALIYVWFYLKEKSDPDLFEKVFLRTLKKYNNQTVLGNLKFQDLENTMNQLYKSFKYLTLKRGENEDPLVAYSSYPSLKCPIPCTYELLTWQTLFAISIIIFALTLFTIITYSVMLRKQNISLRKKLTKIKFTAINSGN